MKLLCLLLSALFLFGCVNKSQEPVIVSKIQSISSLAEKSSCASYKWKDRGTAPAGYIKGMALTYARGVCKGSTLAGDESLGSSDKDALAHYGQSKGSRKLTYALLIGLGMRESSGKYCEGRDSSASNVKSDEAEAGLFQTSFNSRFASPDLSVLLLQYKKGGGNCFLDTFKESVKCTDKMLKIWGTGDGAEFQSLVKSCPAFAAEYASVTLRALRKHYGPINRKEAELRPECLDMLGQIDEAIKADHNLCDGL